MVAKLSNSFRLVIQIPEHLIYELHKVILMTCKEKEKTNSTSCFVPYWKDKFPTQILNSVE